MPRGLEDQWDGRGLFEGEIFGVREAIHFRCANEFGAPTVDHITEVGELAATIIEAGKARGAFAAGQRQGREDHSLADAYGSDLGADLGNFACDVATWYMWQRDQTPGMPWRTQRSRRFRAQARTRLARTSLGRTVRSGASILFQDFGAAVLLELDGLHFWPRVAF